MSQLEIRDRAGMSAAAEAAQAIVAELAEDFRRPSFRAGFGAALLSTAVFARAGARPGLAIFTALMVGAAVEKLYRMAEDVHEAALLKLAGPVLPVFHDQVDCLGHEPGSPGALAKDCPDATGEV